MNSQRIGDLRMATGWLGRGAAVRGSFTFGGSSANVVSEIFGSRRSPQINELAERTLASI